MEPQILEREKQNEQGTETPKVGEAPVAYDWHRRYAIPLANPAAFRFFAEHLVIPHSLQEMLWATLARGWPPLGQKALRVQRRVNGRSPVQEARRGAAAALQTRRLGQECGRHLRRAGLDPDEPIALLTLDDHENFQRGQTVAFLFDASSTKPWAVAKLTADPRQRAVLQREHQTLAWLERSFDSQAPARVPRPLALFEVQPWTVLLESCLPGRTAYFEMRNRWDALRLSPEHFRLALEWLLAFQQATGIREIQLDDSVVAEEVLQPLEDFARLSPLSPAEWKLIEDTAQLARQLRGASLARVARHGDYWAGNLVLDDGRAGVTDWECFAPSSLPFDDLFLFPTTYGVNFPWKLAHWAAPEAAFRATYLQATDIARLARTYLLNYCRCVGLAPELLEVFFPVFLATRALAQAALGAREVAAVSAGAGARGSCVRRVRGEAQSSSGGTWRRLFRVYAQRDEPSCFAGGAERQRG